MERPKVIYDAETDTLSLRLSPQPGQEAEEAAEHVIVTYDAEDRVTAIEIEWASEVLEALVDWARRQPARGQRQ